MQIEQPGVEGATPLDDDSGLKLSWVSTHVQLDAVEADNIRLAANKYLQKKRYAFPEWFTVSHFNLVHKAMFGKVWRWAGKYRRTENNIGLPPYLISTELKKLEEDIQFWSHKHSFNSVEIAARVHYRLVWIHPYENGNGRHGRFMGDMVLRSLGFSPIRWPRLDDNGNARGKYIRALQHGDRGNFSELINFLLEYAEQK